MEERCEKLESRVFDLEQENDKLTTEINTKMSNTPDWSQFAFESLREDCRLVVCDIFRHKLIV